MSKLVTSITNWIELKIASKSWEYIYIRKKIAQNKSK